MPGDNEERFLLTAYVTDYSGDVMGEDRRRREHARRIARVYIRKYNVQAPPTPLDQIVTQEGLTIAPMRWGKASQLDGLLVRNKRIIALNIDKPPRRQRFSLAHELGHYALNHDYIKQFGPDIDIDHPPENAHANYDSLEAEADEFANELLVPGEVLKRVHGAAAQKRRDASEAFHRPFAGLVKRVHQERVLSEKELADLFEVSTEVLFIALTRQKLL